MNGWSSYRNPTVRAQVAHGAQPPPLPLDQDQALQQAITFWQLGWHCGAISRAMGYYHGHWAPGNTWNQRIRRALRA
jgi:hypothetical protein